MSPVSSPNEILQLSSKDIERLDEHQLPKLLRYLLAAEANNARKKGRMLPIMCLNKSMLPMVGVTGIGQVQ